MARRWRRVLPWVVVAAVACSGCKKDETAADDGLAADGARGKRRTPPRVEAVALDELGVQPGMLAGGAVLVAVRADAAQSFLHQLPLPGDVTRELAEARRELGFDPFTDDVLARFAIPPDAVVSMTLGRPVGPTSRKALATGLRHRDERFLGLVSRVLQEPDALALPKPVEIPTEVPATPPPVSPAEPKPIVFAPPAEAPPPPIAPPPVDVAPLIVPPGEPIFTPPPPPPPIDPAERREIEELLRQGDGLAMQMRLHVPSDDPSKIFGELRTRIPAEALRRGNEACRGLAVELCVAGGRELLVARRDGKAAVLDMLFFGTRSDRTADPQARRAALTEALAAPRADLPVLSRLAGHASAFVDPTALLDLLEHMEVGQALRELEWASAPLTEQVTRRFDELEQLRRLLDTPRLFEGLLANAHHERDRTQLQITWPLREDQAELARTVLAPPRLVVPVPTLAGLCDDSLACARSRGLPSPQELGVKLGMGIYGDPRQLEDALEAADEAGVVVMLAATWPNALGTLLWHLPLAEAGSSVGPEGALARSLLAAVARVQGLGLSVRRIDMGRRTVTGELAFYARVPVNDLGLVSTLLALAEQRMVPTTVEGVEGTVSMLRIPEDDVPVVLMTREDPETVESGDDEVRYGWLTLVDAPPRLAWLLGLPTDDGEEPLAYGEVPDLWRLVASVPEAVDELGFARTWASERRLAVALRLDDGQPHLLVDVALRPAAGAGSK